MTHDISLHAPQSKSLWLTLSMVAPLIGQCIVGVVMATQGNWMILLMMLPTTGVMIMSYLAMRHYSSRHTYSAEPHHVTDQASFPTHSTHTTHTAQSLYTSQTIGTTHTPSSNLDTQHQLLPIQEQIQACTQLDPHINTFAFNTDYAWQRIAHIWSTRLEAHEHSSYQPLHTLQATVGLELNAETQQWQPYTLDLLQTGPHALIAGTTGSGKSYILRTWVCALAMQYPPQDVQFVFLDFKGGATFHDLQQLPHTVGFVSDLNISHALRALRAIEAELHRREQLVAQYQASDIDHIPCPPARLLIIIDEFAALRAKLADAMTRLDTLATLGRSLGMHLIACTQHPLGQMGSDMKANIGLHICMRVRDATQSRDLLGVPDATSISPTAAGVALSHDGDSLHVWRGSIIQEPQRILHACRQAWQAYGQPNEIITLFSDPLPRIVPPAPILDPSTAQIHPSTAQIHPSAAQIHPNAAQIQSPNLMPELRCSIGFADTGTHCMPLSIDIAEGNIAIIGLPQRGTSTVLQSLYMQLAPIAQYYGMNCILQQCDFPESPLCSTQQHTTGQITALYIVDEADQLLNPTNITQDALDFRNNLADPHSRVLFAVHSARFVRHPEHCVTRIIFATGDISTDALTGLEPSILAQCESEEFQMPGRAFVLQHGVCTKVQCHSV